MHPRLFERDDEEVGYHFSPQEEKKSYGKPVSRTPINPIRTSQPDGPIFELRRFTDYNEFPMTNQGTPGYAIDCAVSNNVVVIGTTTGHLLRWDLKTDNRSEISVTKGKDEINKVFLDPQGSHCIVSCNSGLNYYYHSAKKKLYPIIKQRETGMSSIIEAIGWNREESSLDSTGHILLGMRDGVILDVMLEAGKEKGAPIKVFQAKNSASICGIHIELCKDPASKDKRWFVIAATSQMQYQFVGGPTFEAMFSENANNLQYRELPGDVRQAELKMLRVNDAPVAIAHLTGVGVHFGKVQLAGKSPGSNCLVDDDILYYAKLSESAPSSIMITNYHILFLYPRRIVGIDQLSKQVVFSSDFSPKSGIMVGVRWDEINNQVWIFGQSSFYEVVTNDETRDLWWLYLEASRFTEALKHSKSDEQRELIVEAHAKFLFEESDFESAAVVYSSSRKSFEEISLKFVQEGAIPALKIFLQRKLDEYVNADAGIRAEFLAQRTMISTWLVELYLDDLNEAKLVGGQQLSMLRSEFRKFIRGYISNLHPETTFNLITSHGLDDEMLHFAMMIGDHDRMIAHFIRQRDYEGALDELLQRQDDVGNNTALDELFCRYIPILIYQMPRQTVEMLKTVHSVSPAKLLPALMRYDLSRNEPGDLVNYCIEYLEFCINSLRITDSALHNYLISLYAKEDSEDRILAFISAQKFREYYDLKYALRLCHQQGKKRACVLLYSHMQLFIDAVKLALDIDVEFAKSIAVDLPDDHPDKKKLWLLIGAHVVQHQANVGEAIKVLKASSLLHIEDILPLFPENVQISDFREEISSSLEGYTEKIDDLKREMNEFTSIADRIRKDIHSLKTRYGDIHAKQACDLCYKPVLQQRFYLFPCTHVFHVTCAEERVIQHLSRHPHRLQYFDPVGEDLDRMKADSELRKNYQEFTKSECFLCGDLMIESVVDVPFLSAEDDPALWRI